MRRLLERAKASKREREKQLPRQCVHVFFLLCFSLISTDTNKERRTRRLVQRNEQTQSHFIFSAASFSHMPIGEWNNTRNLNGRKVHVCIHVHTHTLGLQLNRVPFNNNQHWIPVRRVVCLYKNELYSAATSKACQNNSAICIELAMSKKTPFKTRTKGKERLACMQNKNSLMSNKKCVP